MLKRIIILIAMVAGIACAANGYCTEFMVWNPATKDTLVHFSTKAPGLPELNSTYWDGICTYDTGWTAKIVTWECNHIYKIKDGKATKTVHNGSSSLNPYTFFCKAKI